MYFAFMALRLKQWTKKQSQVGSTSLEGEVSRVFRQPSQARGALVYKHSYIVIVEWLSNIILCRVVAREQRGSSSMLVEVSVPEQDPIGNL